MALIFERIHTDGIAGLSYLVGDDSGGVAAVFDPRADVDCCLELAREKQVVTYTISVKGAKAGDSRNKIILTCDELTSSVEETESTTVY